MLKNRRWTRLHNWTQLWRRRTTYLEHCFKTSLILSNLGVLSSQLSVYRVPCERRIKNYLELQNLRKGNEVSMIKMHSIHILNCQKMKIKKKTNAKIKRTKKTFREWAINCRQRGAGSGQFYSLLFPINESKVTVEWTRKIKMVSAYH